MPQNGPKRQPPDQIVCDDCQTGRPRELTLHRGSHKTDRTKNFPQQTHQHNRPVTYRVQRRRSVADTVNSHNHPNALPQARIIRRINSHPAKRNQREKDDPRPPHKIVNRCHQQNPSHPDRRRVHFRSTAAHCAARCIRFEIASLLISRILVRTVQLSTGNFCRSRHCKPASAGKLLPAEAVPADSSPISAGNQVSADAGQPRTKNCGCFGKPANMGANGSG